MDIDPPNLCPNLKRSNSAPMINELGNTSTNSQELRSRGSSTPVAQRTPRLMQTRRFSGSFSPSRSSHSPTAPLSPLVLSRVSQIKQEESMDVVFREAAHERETKSKLQISHSLEDLTLDEASFGDNKRQSVTDPLKIHTSHIVMCSSPSPTNTGRQCFSPSTCLPVQHSAFSSTPSPSPTRKNFTRCSQSPISLRPSQLSLKRKFDMDSDDSDYMPSSAKHLNTGMSSPESELRPNPPHIQNLSFNSMDTCNSSDQSDSRRSTDSISSCISSPYGTFKPVEPAPSHQKPYN
ncbi:P2R1A-PPP2R2A-interacting phosphatase regulator 1 [Parasteatoda tepidariorum]|uniref:P2R1A-PPP2R2A-interacting phosphatase regulator 1 n=1 Tax=Parasteatoda tepidariorum TaxID=114398 RepID=UPI00077FE37B|nr:P2R1A-PPP2R2A-interacting phosphatase regulator 1 [Parasteatoda tepidariorum]